MKFKGWGAEAKLNDFLSILTSLDCHWELIESYDSFNDAEPDIGELNEIETFVIKERAGRLYMWPPLGRVGSSLGFAMEVSVRLNTQCLFGSVDTAIDLTEFGLVNRGTIIRSVKALNVFAPVFWQLGSPIGCETIVPLQSQRGEGVIEALRRYGYDFGKESITEGPFHVYNLDTSNLPSSTYDEEYEAMLKDSME